MNTFFLICFFLGLTLSLLAVLSGTGRLHFGHHHIGPGHAHAQPGMHVSFFNGFTIPAFLCWFGGAAWLLQNYSPILTRFVLLLAALAGLLVAGAFYLFLTRVLLPAERPLTAEDTRMDGVVGRVSDEIRTNGIGEILFSQIGARRASAARSETGLPIPRGTEVVVLRYARGIAYVSPLHELSHSAEEHPGHTLNS